MKEIVSQETIDAKSINMRNLSSGHKFFKNGIIIKADAQKFNAIRKVLQLGFAAANTLYGLKVGSAYKV